MTEKNVNYPKDLTLAIIVAYQAGETDAERATIVESLSAEHGKSVKSIRQKLVREGVYIKPEYVSKAGNTVERKSDIVQGIAKMLDVTEAQLGGLEKATKPALETIRRGFVAAAAALALALGDPSEDAVALEDAQAED